MGGGGGQTSTCGNQKIDPGEICFGAPVRLATSSPGNVRIGRFDGDSHLDILVYALSGRPTQGRPEILYGSGDGTFTTPQELSNIPFMQSAGFDTGDLDGNGTDDVVSADYSMNRIDVVRTGQGAGRDLAYSVYSAANYTSGFSGVAIGRLPSAPSQPIDALPDILSVSKRRLVGPPEGFLGYLEYFTATGPGVFGPSALTDIAGTMCGPLTTLFQMIDVDGSGSADVVCVDGYNKRINVLFDLMTPQYRIVSLAYEPFFPGSAPVGPGAVVADFDGDGWKDISAAQTPSGLPQPAIYWGNKSSKTFGAATTLDPAPITYTAANWAAAGDMNKDGVLDLIVGALMPADTSNSTGSRIGVYVGRGQRSFDRVLIDLPGIIPLDCAVGDLNEDTVPDLACGTYTTNELYVLLSTR